MAGISSKAAGKLENRYKYNTWERNTDLELNVDESFYRVNDYQIGRFWQIDPKLEFGIENWSPYTSNLDNPLRYTDPLGDLPSDDDPPSRKSLFNPPEAETINKYPAIALLQGVGYLAWNLTGLATVEEFINDRRDGKNSAGEITVGLAEVGLATTRGGKGPISEKLTVEVKPYGKFKVGENDGHHIIQNAAVKDISGYSKDAAPATKIEGPSTKKGTPHYAATESQRTTPLKGGTYARERVIGYKALVEAGVPKEFAKQMVRMSDKYFESIGVKMNTPTRTPGNRVNK